MHVDVDQLRRQLEIQRGHRVAAERDHVAIGDAQRGLQQRVGHRPAVHHQALLRRRGARRGRRAGEAADTQRAALGLDRQQAGGVGAEQGGDPRRPVLRRQVEQHAAVGLQPERRRRARPGRGGAPPASACSASVRGCLRNLRRAGVAKNRSVTTARVPGGAGGRARPARPGRPRPGSDARAARRAGGRPDAAGRRRRCWAAPRRGSRGW